MVLSCVLHLHIFKCQLGMEKDKKTESVMPEYLQKNLRQTWLYTVAHTYPTKQQVQDNTACFSFFSPATQLLNFQSHTSCIKLINFNWHFKNKVSHYCFCNSYEITFWKQKRQIRTCSRKDKLILFSCINSQTQLYSPTGDLLHVN